MASPNRLVFYIYDLQIVLLLSLLFLCFCLYTNFIWKKRQMFIKSWNFPGPFNLPIIGSGYLFMTRPEYIYERLIALQKKYPTGYKLWFGNRLVYGLTEPAQIEKVLGSTRLVQKEILYKHIVEVIGEGLLTAPAQKWKKHRKYIMPSFNQKTLDSYVKVFAEQGLILTEVLADTYGKKTDIHELLSRCTLAIVCETAMGLQLDIQKNNSDYGRVFDKLMLLTFLKIFQLWNHVDFIWKILGYEKKLKGYLTKFNNLTDLVIKQKIEVMEEKKHRKSSSDGIEAPLKRLAFLDLIMDCGQFDALELREEVNILLFAATDTTAAALSFVFAVLGMFPEVQATDTTAAALSFVFAVLGMFPEVQEKVLEEVTQILGNDRSPEYQDLPQLMYTERVIKETLRLFPVVGFFSRAITEDVDMGNFVIPQGAAVNFCLAFIHRNPKYWPDPLKFDPDRFLPEEVAKRHPCTYIPFSFGPRNCIGMKYGMMNMKVIISTVIRKFRIHCEYKKIEDVKLKANIVLRFQDGAKVSVIPREQ